jgi:hypothetical protein
LYESLTAEREQIPKNSQYEFSPSWYFSLTEEYQGRTEEYQDGENSYCEFFGLCSLSSVSDSYGDHPDSSNQ